MIIYIMGPPTRHLALCIAGTFIDVHDLSRAYRGAVFPHAHTGRVSGPSRGLGRPLPRPRLLRLPGGVPVPGERGTLLATFCGWDGGGPARAIRPAAPAGETSPAETATAIAPRASRTRVRIRDDPVPRLTPEPPSDGRGAPRRRRVPDSRGVRPESPPAGSPRGA